MENSERDGNTRPPDLPPEKSVCQEARVRTGPGTTKSLQMVTAAMKLQDAYSLEGKL